MCHLSFFFSCLFHVTKTKSEGTGFRSYIEMYTCDARQLSRATATGAAALLLAPLWAIFHAGHPSSSSSSEDKERGRYGVVRKLCQYYPWTPPGQRSLTAVEGNRSLLGSC